MVLLTFGKICRDEDTEVGAVLVRGKRCLLPFRRGTVRESGVQDGGIHTLKRSAVVCVCVCGGGEAVFKGI